MEPIRTDFSYHIAGKSDYAAMADEPDLYDLSRQADDRLLGNVSLCVPTCHPYDLGSAAGAMPAGRVWSLWDMINYTLTGLVGCS